MKTLLVAALVAMAVGCSPEQILTNDSGPVPVFKGDFEEYGVELVEHYGSVAAVVKSWDDATISADPDCPTRARITSWCRTLVAAYAEGSVTRDFISECDTRVYHHDELYNDRAMTGLGYDCPDECDGTPEAGYCLTGLWWLGHATAMLHGEWFDCRFRDQKYFYKYWEVFWYNTDGERWRYKHIEEYPPWS